MPISSKKLSSLLLLTESLATRDFFNRALSKFENTTLIHTEDETDFFSQLSRTKAICILIDEKTPRIDLFALCEKIRTFKDHSSTPILVISSQLKKEFIRQTLKSGATDFLRHPLNESDFLYRFEVAKNIIETNSKVAELTSQFNSIPIPSSSLKKRTILSDRIVRLMSQAIEDKESLTLILLEIQPFITLSPSRKKKVGKELLLKVEEKVRESIRSQDLLFHQGEGTFILILPNTSHNASLSIVENIELSFTDYIFSSKEISIPITMATGTAFMPAHSPKKKNPTFYLDTLLREAKEELSSAKKEKKKR